MAQMQGTIGAGGKSKNGWRWLGHRATLGAGRKGKKPVVEFSEFSRITCAADIDAGLLQLRQIDGVLADVADGLDEVPLRLRPAGFRGLAEIIVGQQVSKASAAAIFGRLEAAIIPFEPARFLQLGERVQIESGLSRAKQVTLTGLANKIVAGDIDLTTLGGLTADEAQEQLVALKGIGPWTAEVFLLFCAGHRDVFPAGDVALQQAIADIYSLEVRPDTKQAREFSERWQPVRGIAARVLWAKYARDRKRSDLPV